MLLIVSNNIISMHALLKLVPCWQYGTVFLQSYLPNTANTSSLNIKWRFCLVLNTCGHFQHLRSQFFSLYRPFASLGVNAFGCFVGRIHLNQNEYCYSMFIFCKIWKCQYICLWNSKKANILNKVNTSVLAMHCS